MGLLRIVWVCLFVSMSGAFRTVALDSVFGVVFYRVFHYVCVLFFLDFLFVGLISDSFHMFFDCTGLLAGLAASVITKWKANDKFSYGYVRAEVLAGFVNSLFLLFIAFFILAEGVERAIEPPEVSLSRVWG